MKEQKSQRQIDISNLRFYAAMAHDFKWQTDIIHYAVISHTLSEIADRLAEMPTLLHGPSDPLPEGCYCKPGQCMAPVIMGRQMPCRDPEKAQGRTRCCDNGYFGEQHDCQKSNGEQSSK